MTTIVTGFFQQSQRLFGVIGITLLGRRRVQQGRYKSSMRGKHGIVPQVGHHAVEVNGMAQRLTDAYIEQRTFPVDVKVGVNHKAQVIGLDKRRFLQAYVGESIAKPTSRVK